MRWLIVQQRLEKRPKGGGGGRSGGSHKSRLEQDFEEDLRFIRESKSREHKTRTKRKNKPMES